MLRPPKRPMDPRLLRAAMLAAAQSPTRTSSAPPITSYLLNAPAGSVLTNSSGNRLRNA